MNKVLGLICILGVASALNTNDDSVQKQQQNGIKVREPRRYQQQWEPSRFITYDLREPVVYTPFSNEADSQYQYQSTNSQKFGQVAGQDYYGGGPEHRRYYRQVGTYYPPSWNPRYQVNENSQYQLQANAQKYTQGDYNNYDELNARYQSQEQAAYHRQRSRLY